MSLNVFTVKLTDAEMDIICWIGQGTLLSRSDTIRAILISAATAAECPSELLQRAEAERAQHKSRRSVHFSTNAWFDYHASEN